MNTKDDWAETSKACFSPLRHVYNAQYLFGFSSLLLRPRLAEDSLSGGADRHASSQPSSPGPRHAKFARCARNLNKWYG
jgi:hypothetical protein